MSSASITTRPLTPRSAASVARKPPGQWSQRPASVVKPYSVRMNLSPSVYVTSVPASLVKRSRSAAASRFSPASTRGAHLGGGEKALQDFLRLDDEEDAAARLLHRDLLVGEEEEHVVDDHVGVQTGLHRLRVLAERVLPDVGDPHRRVLRAVGGEVHVGHVGAEVARGGERGLPVVVELIAFREDGDRLPRPHLAELQVAPEQLRQPCLILPCAHESGSHSAALASAYSAALTSAV